MKRSVRRPVKLVAGSLVGCALVLAACDELPQAPAGDAAESESSSESTSPGSSGPIGSGSSAAAMPPPTDLDAIGNRALEVAMTYASRCIVTEFFAEAGYDLCWRIEHCSAAVRLNLSDAPCGFTEEERKAVIDAGKEAEALVAQHAVPDAAALFFKHVALFGRWVDETTAIAGCIERSPFGNAYCYEKTRGTMAKAQELARAFYDWQPAEDPFIVPPAYSCFEGAAPYRKLSDPVRRAGLPWGECPGGACLVQGGNEQPESFW